MPAWRCTAEALQHGSSSKAMNSAAHPGHTQGEATKGLETRGLSKQFGGIYAVRDVSIRIGDGEIVGLIGPNGAGKTSLMNLISGVLRCDSGEILVDGDNVEGLSTARRAQRGIARTFQNIRVFTHLDVRQNVQVAHTTALRHRGGDDGGDTIEAILEELGLARHAGQRAGTLPYGTQRRLEIARALALRPRVLMLDEPAAGMNEQETQALMASIRALSRRHRLGVVVIDHDLRFIMQLCERIYVMHMGEIIAHDAPEAIRRDPEVQEVYLGGRRG